jgi:predicted ATPase
LIAVEEPERGVHPRLLGEIRYALNRLAFPQEYGDPREPTQVVVTTHSPYLLGCFRESPEQVIVAEKTDKGASFSRLSDHRDLDKILGDTSLGDAWYAGILGGVPRQ